MVFKLGSAQQRTIPGQTHPQEPHSAGQGGQDRDAYSAGSIRIDGVHQGDPAGFQGVLHINAVDCVTQLDVAAKVQGRDAAQPLPYRMTNSLLQCPKHR